MWHAFAVSGESLRWVCLCRDRLELVAKCFPHSPHWCFSRPLLDNLDLPSDWWRESTVNDLMLVNDSIENDLMFVSGNEMSE